MSHQLGLKSELDVCQSRSGNILYTDVCGMWQTGSQWKLKSSRVDPSCVCRHAMHERPTAFRWIDFFFLPLPRYTVASPKWLVIHISYKQLINIYTLLYTLCSCININILGLSLFRWLVARGLGCKLVHAQWDCEADTHRRTRNSSEGQPTANPKDSSQTFWSVRNRTEWSDEATDWYGETMQMSFIPIRRSVLLCSKGTLYHFPEMNIRKLTWLLPWTVNRNEYSAAYTGNRWILELWKSF